MSKAGMLPHAACFSPQPWGKYSYSSLGHSAALEQRLGEREIPFTPRASGLAGRETHHEPLWVDAFYAAVDPPEAQGVLQSVLIGDRLSARGFILILPMLLRTQDKYILTQLP